MKSTVYASFLAKTASLRTVLGRLHGKIGVLTLLFL